MEAAGLDLNRYDLSLLDHTGTPDSGDSRGLDTRERCETFMTRMDSKLREVVARVEKRMMDTLEEVSSDTYKFREEVAREAQEFMKRD